MRTNLLKTSLVLALVVLLSACSHFRKGNDDNKTEAVAETEGTQVESGIVDQSAANKLKAPFDQTYYFDFNKYDMNQDDRASVNVQAHYLVEHANTPTHVRLEGHADERGSREYNVALGWRRAQAVADAMKQQGVNSKQLSVLSFGKEKPVALGHDEAAYRLNRRASLVYEAK